MAMPEKPGANKIDSIGRRVALKRYRLSISPFQATSTQKITKDLDKGQANHLFHVSGVAKTYNDLVQALKTPAVIASWVEKFVIDHPRCKALFYDPDTGKVRRRLKEEEVIDFTMTLQSETTSFNQMNGGQYNLDDDFIGDPLMNLTKEEKQFEYLTLIYEELKLVLIQHRIDQAKLKSTAMGGALKDLRQRDFFLGEKAQMKGFIGFRQKIMDTREKLLFPYNSPADFTIILQENIRKTNPIIEKTKEFSKLLDKGILDLHKYNFLLMQDDHMEDLAEVLRLKSQ
jgi:hypothetical protein